MYKSASGASRTNPTIATGVDLRTPADHDDDGSDHGNDRG
jgi:hypothetical protein